MATAAASKVIRVIDGDTLLLRAEWVPEPLPKQIYLRVAGIDTPEMKGKCADETDLALEAKAYTETFVKTREIEIDLVSWDKYGGRILGNIRAQDGGDLATELLTHGLGREYKGGRKLSWC